MSICLASDVFFIPTNPGFWEWEVNILRILYTSRATESKNVLQKHESLIVFFSYLDKDTGTTDFDFNKILSDSDQFDSIVGFVPEHITPNPEVTKTFGDNFIEYDFTNAEEDSLSDDSLRLVHAELYFAMDNETLPLNSIKVFSIRGEELKEISGSQTIRMNDTQLLALNVTKIVQNWIFYPNAPRKLYVKIDGNNGELSFYLVPALLFGPPNDFIVLA